MYGKIKGYRGPIVAATDASYKRGVAGIACVVSNGSWGLSRWGSANRHDPSGRLPDSHIDDAIPPADVLRGDTDRPSPVQSGAGPKGDECLPGPEPGRCGLVLSIPPQQLEFVGRVGRGDPPTVDRLAGVQASGRERVWLGSRTSAAITRSKARRTRAAR